MDQSIYNGGGERHSGRGLQVFAVEDRSNPRTRVIIQQLIDFFYCAVGGLSPMPGIQRCRYRQALRGAAPEPHVQRNAVSFDNRHVLDQQTNHSFPFPVGQSRVLPDLPKIGRKSKDLPTLRIVQHEVV
jgi:hypothetical protein